MPDRKTQNLRGGKGWVQFRQRVWNTYGAEGCHLCGRPIDPDLKWPHPASFVVDHIIPIAHGGTVRDITNGLPSHKACNEERGTLTIAQWRAKQAGHHTPERGACQPSDQTTIRDYPRKGQVWKLAEGWYRCAAHPWAGITLDPAAAHDHARDTGCCSAFAPSTRTR